MNNDVIIQILDLLNEIKSIMIISAISFGAILSIILFEIGINKFANDLTNKIKNLIEKVK